MSSSRTPSAAPAAAVPETGRWLTAFPASLSLWLSLLIFAAGLWPQALMNDADTLWHLTAGQYMRDHKTLLTTDPFSFTHAGQPWHTHEWLSEVLMSQVFEWMGWPGLMAMSAGAIALTAFICLRYGARWLPGLTLGLMVCLGLSLIGPHYLARPHLFVLPLLAALMSVLMRAREANERPPLILAGLFLLWANMHASFIFGLGLTGFFALEAILAAPSGQRVKTAKSWGLVLALSVIASILTPQGPYGLIFPFALAFMPGIDGIAEWAPARVDQLSPLLIVLAVGVYVILRYRPRLTLLRAALLLGLVALSLMHVRHEMMLGIVAIFLLGEPLGRVMNRTHATEARTPLPAVRVTLCLALAVLGLRLLLPVPAPDTPQHPSEALEAVPVALRNQPVLNDYGFGGFLIASGVRPFIDGRADMYGPAFLKAYDEIMAANPRDLAQALNARSINWTLLRPQTQAAQSLEDLPGWRKLYAGPKAVVFVREDVMTTPSAPPAFQPLRQR